MFSDHNSQNSMPSNEFPYSFGGGEDRASEHLQATWPDVRRSKQQENLS